MTRTAIALPFHPSPSLRRRLRRYSRPSPLACTALLLALCLVSSHRGFAQSTPEPAADSNTSAPHPAQPAEPVTAPPAATVAPAAPAQAGAGSSKVDSATYMIGPEDVLQVTVWHEPTLSGVLPVRPDGMISLALLGDVKAAGFTPMQLSTEITERLRKYIQDPSVTIAVTAVNSQRVFLVGEVNKVGPVPLTPGMTPLQAISTAGGPSPFANSKRIYILRGSGSSQKKIPYNYKQALKGDDKSGLTLQPGDTIVIP